MEVGEIDSIETMISLLDPPSGRRERAFEVASRGSRTLAMTVWLARER